MAITEIKEILWNPDPRVLKQKLDVHESDAPLFQKAYAEAVKRFSPCVYYQAARLEAIGDAFVLLSGIFIEDERLVRALSGAGKLWAFAVAGVEADVGMEWLLTLSEIAARDSAYEWINGLTRQTGERYQPIFFQQTKEWMDLFSLPPDLATGLCGVAYAASGCARCRTGQKCEGCRACLQ